LRGVATVARDTAVRGAACAPRPQEIPKCAALPYSALLDHRTERAMSEISLKGSCLCGAVKYEAIGEPKRFLHCHCSRCRKATGTGHASNLFLQPAELKWIRGAEHLRAFKVPEAKRFTNQFCAICGSRLPRQAKDTDVVLIPAGSLDDEVPITPQARIFTASRASWSCVGDGLPAYPELAPPVP
jgi:hypothetical protein